MTCKAIMFALLIIASPVQAAQMTQGVLGGIKETTWVPSVSGTYPLVLFSHGFGGCSTQSKFLTSAIADAGYIVIAPEHKDANCRGGASQSSAANGGSIRDRIRNRIMSDQHGDMRPDISFRKPEKWSDKTYIDRRNDVESVLNAAAASGKIGSAVIDISRIAVMGHSLGGYTAMAMGGAWPAWKEPRIQTVIALSPFAQPFFNTGNGLSRMNVPVMLQGGTRDMGITPELNKANGIYDMLGEPKYFVEFDQTGHFGFTDAIDSHHDLMISYSIAFLDCNLKQKNCGTLNQKQNGVSELRSKQ